MFHAVRKAVGPTLEEAIRDVVNAIPEEVEDE